MIKVGIPPYLECSSKGDIRFSAFYARPKSLNGRSIEEAFQGMKILDGHSGWHWSQAKGRKAENADECEQAYRRWWAAWVQEQRLLPVLQAASGLSDRFGQRGHVCQALVLWDIRNG